ncbi:MAG TPA: MFS transporter [Saprospiraceae bacterium]|nr:MFS transporter [Saprospiraceae bacterium]
MMPRSLFVRLSLMLVLQFFVWGCWYVTAGVYLRKSLSFTGGEVGWVYACPGIAAIVMPFLVGRLADKYFPIERILSVLHALAGCALIGAAQAQNFEQFFPFILINALCYQPTMSLAISMCFYHQVEGADQFPKIRLWGTLGWITGGILVSLMSWENSPMPMYAAAIVSFVMSAYCLTLPSAVPLGKETSRTDVILMLKNRSLIYLFIAMFFMMIPSSFYYSFVNPFLVDQGVEYPAAKMSLGQISEIAVLFFLPQIVSRLKIRTIITIGFGVWGARYLLFLLPKDTFELSYLFALSLHGVAFCFSALTAQIYVNKIGGATMRATAQGAYSFVVMGLGTMVGSFIAGNVVDMATTDVTDNTSWSLVWAFAGLFGVATSLVFYLTSKDRLKEA